MTAVAVAGETPVRRMLGVLQAFISGQQPDMRAVHKLHELIVSGDITGDVSVSAGLSWLLIAYALLAYARLILKPYPYAYVTPGCLRFEEPSSCMLQETCANQAKRMLIT